MNERDSWKVFGVCVVLAGLLSAFVLDPLLAAPADLAPQWGGSAQSSALK